MAWVAFLAVTSICGSHSLQDVLSVDSFLQHYVVPSATMMSLLQPFSKSKVT
jgi:hypothetical protein